MGREAGKVFTYGIQDPDIKIQLLLGGENTVNEDLRQAGCIGSHQTIQK
jgi:hypothetical protein